MSNAYIESVESNADEQITAAFVVQNPDFSSDDTYVTVKLDGQLAEDYNWTISSFSQKSKILDINGVPGGDHEVCVNAT